MQQLTVPVSVSCTNVICSSFLRASLIGWEQLETLIKQQDLDEERQGLLLCCLMSFIEKLGS